jgi:hypothetical protein
MFNMTLCPTLVFVIAVPRIDNQMTFPAYLVIDRGV